MRTMLRWLKGLFNYAEFVISLSFFVVVTSVVLWLAWPDWVGNSDFPGDVLVEAHGLVFDLAALGVLFSIFRYIALQREEKRRAEEQRRADEQRAEDARQARIARYNEEIDDFRYWKSDEAAHRIAGNIRRLNKEGVVPEDLSEANLQGTRLNLLTLRGTKLDRTNLQGAHLQCSDMRGVDFYEANLQGALMMESKLQGSNLIWANLQGANLQDANLQGAKLRATDLKNANLRGAKLQGADLIETDFRNTNLETVNIKDARYNTQIIFSDFSDHLPTRWPDGFTPPPDAIDMTPPTPPAAPPPAPTSD